MLLIFEKILRASRTNEEEINPLLFLLRMHAMRLIVKYSNSKERRKREGKKKKYTFVFHERVVTSKNFKFGKCLIA